MLCHLFEIRSRVPIEDIIAMSDNAKLRHPACAQLTNNDTKDAILPIKHMIVYGQAGQNGTPNCLRKQPNKFSIQQQEQHALQDWMGFELEAPTKAKKGIRWLSERS